MKKIHFFTFFTLIVLIFVAGRCTKTELFSIEKCEFTRSEIVSSSRLTPWGLIPEEKTVYYYNLTLENDSVVEYKTTTENYVPSKNHKFMVKNNNYSSGTIATEVNLNF